MVLVNWVINDRYPWHSEPTIVTILIFTAFSGLEEGWGSSMLADNSDSTPQAMTITTHQGF